MDRGRQSEQLLVTARGVARLFAVHRDPVDLVLTLAQAVRLPLTSRLFDRLLSLAVRTPSRKEVAVGAVTERSNAATRERLKSGTR